LSLSAVAITSGFALGYLKQPRFLTEYAGGPLLYRVPYIKGLVAGVIASPFLPSVPPCLTCLRVMSGECTGRTGQNVRTFNVRVMARQLLSRLVGVGVLVGVQGHLMRARFHPNFASGFCGFAGGVVTLYPVMMKLTEPPPP